MTNNRTIKLAPEMWLEENQSALWSIFCDMSPLPQDQWTPMQVALQFNAWCFKRYQKYAEE